MIDEYLSDKYTAYCGSIGCEEISQPIFWSTKTVPEEPPERVFKIKCRKEQ
jgi:hypothetical protein